MNQPVRDPAAQLPPGSTHAATRQLTTLLLAYGAALVGGPVVFLIALGHFGG